MGTSQQLGFFWLSRRGIEFVFTFTRHRGPLAAGARRHRDPPAATEARPPPGEALGASSAARPGAARALPWPFVSPRAALHAPYHNGVVAKLHRVVLDR